MTALEETTRNNTYVAYCGAAIGEDIVDFVFGLAAGRTPRPFHFFVLFRITHLLLSGCSLHKTP